RLKWRRASCRGLLTMRTDHFSETMTSSPRNRPPWRTRHCRVVSRSWAFNNLRRVLHRLLREQGGGRSVQARSGAMLSRASRVTARGTRMMILIRMRMVRWHRSGGERWD
ncbi:hypothetical protein LTS18_005537, partial [Coniosporium uncinatum]